MEDNDNNILNYWCKWAIAVYGWKLLWSWKNFDIQSTLKGLCSSNKCNNDSVINYLNIDQDSLIKTKWISSPQRPAYFLAVDNNTKNIVLSIRGTMSIADIITDCNVFTRKFKPNNIDHGVTHFGIKNAANYIFADVLNDLLIQINKYPTYGIRFVGHSLGAGVAGLLTHTFLSYYDNYKNKLKTYCYGCPPVFNKELANEHKDIITTVINKNDIVARFSVNKNLYLPGTILHYDNSMFRMLDQTELSKKKIIFGKFLDHFPERYENIN